MAITNIAQKLPGVLHPLTIFILFYFLEFTSSKPQKLEVFKTELFINDGKFNYGLYEGFVRGRRRFGNTHVPHGTGIINYFTKDPLKRANYTGEWVNGEREGKGQTTFRDGSVYVGHYRAGMEDGRGTIHYANGNTLNGEFRDGKIHGHVVFKYKNGDQREGFFQNNILNGQVIFTKSNGRTIIEFWENGERIEAGIEENTVPSLKIKPKLSKSVSKFRSKTPITNKFKRLPSQNNSIKSENLFVKKVPVFRKPQDRFSLTKPNPTGQRKVPEIMKSLRRLVNEDRQNFLKSLFNQIS